MHDIFTTLRKIRRLPRPHRIAFLQSLTALEPPRSIRRAELEAALKAEMTAQLRKENRRSA
jgi:hypothetical protein